MDILTQNPEVWKKTIFILTYDENDGYFDHVPPFTAPHSGKNETGKASEGWIPVWNLLHFNRKRKEKDFLIPYSRESSIGLGFRVPLIVASPWSRGGLVNSEMFEHTSTLQFLEKFLSNENGKIYSGFQYQRMASRTISGDLTSVFQPSSGHPFRT